MRKIQKIIYSKTPASLGFTLVEVSVSLIILAIISSATLVVINNYMDTAANAQLRLEALNTARENMETLLAMDSVSDTAESGTLESNPLIQYETNVENFYEPITSRMWIRAICSASFTDSQGEIQTVELTHWLTDVSKQQVIQIMNQEKKLQEYAEKLQELQELGVELTDEQLEVLQESDIPQKQEQQQEQEQNVNNLTESEKNNPVQEQTDGQKYYGYTEEELNKMTFEQVWKIFMEGK